MLTPLALTAHAWSGARSVSQPGQTLLDRLMPAWDATRVEWRLVAAPPCVVYNAAINADFLDAVREHRAVRVLFAVRSSAERLAGAFRRHHPPPPAPAALRLAGLPTYGEWVLLGNAPPNEISFGAVGRFWAGETRWEAIDAGAFAGFDRPGYAKIACSLLLRTLDDGRTVLTYEARTRATDDAARRAFRRYWRAVSPFVGVVMRSTLAVIARDAALAAAG